LEICLVFTIFAPRKVIICMMNDEVRLVKILQISHSQAMAGKTYSQEEVDSYLDQRHYEFRDKMVGACVAEPC
jgi:hypothetical protein